ncbi:hypothetical protein cand_025490 [Cryptosporidium andersoni]|uniref:SET domain-containing protein n=1 Tax=Cryptosporidium andersoni TaxID=117008 RepID=A0A1J4ME40_9CRYT|nr:hypothetical protein cand_025490 [Cryptosporidium andersoni]
MSDCSSINCYIDQYYDLLLEQMHLKIGNNTFPFKIYNSSNKGKHIHSTMILNENTEILQEVPFICWPIKSSFGSIKDISFCENCMKIRNSENSDTFLSYSDLNIEKGLCSSYCYNKCVGISRDDNNKPELFNGWGFYIQGKTGLNMLRDYQTRIDPNYNLPITIEAISRCIAQLAADIHFFWNKLGKIRDNINNAFNLGCKSVENLIAPPVTFFPEINLELVTEYINTVMFNRMKEVFPNEVIHALLGRSTVEQILGQLVLNSQGLNIWGRSLNIAIYNSQISNNIQCNDEIGIIKAACICTIQSCFNHSCEPNCYVHAIDDATVVVTTNKEILLGEELTISYIDNTLDYESRKSLLKNYHFECTCNLCRRQRRSRPNKVEFSDPKKTKYIMIE